MKIIDLNLLLYAVNAEAAEHQRASKWLKSLFRSEARIGFAWTVVLGFLRLTTSRVVFQRPWSPAEAVDQLNDWLGHPSSELLTPTGASWPTLCALVVGHGTRGNLVTDADLVATALTHGATLCTADRDFLKFTGIQIEFPLDPTH